MLEVGLVTGARRNGLEQGCRALGLCALLSVRGGLTGGVRKTPVTLLRVGHRQQHGQDGEEEMTREGSAVMQGTDH